MYKIIVFAPKSDVDTLISVMGDAGAGKIGHYSHCAFVTQGVGHWKSLTGAKPTIGKVGEVSIEKQFRVEMVCPQADLDSVITAIHKNHSFETPEINIIKLEDDNNRLFPNKLDE